MVMGASMCGALATLVAIGTLGAIWVGATRCQWPTKFDTSNQFAIFCHGQIAIFWPKKLKLIGCGQPKALWVLGVACGHPCPQLGMPHAMGGCKKWAVLVNLSLNLLEFTSYHGMLEYTKQLHDIICLFHRPEETRAVKVGKELKILEAFHGTPERVRESSSK